MMTPFVQAPSDDGVKAKNRKIEESSSKQATGSVANNRTKTIGRTTKTISDKKQEPDAGSKHQPTDDAKVAHADRCVFLSNLAYTVSEEDVKEMLSAVGNITHVSIEKDSKGKSKGFGHVEFQNKIAAQEALKKDREPVKGRLMFVSQYAVDRQHRTNPASMFAKTLEKTKLFVKGLPLSVTEDDLKRIFGQHATPKAVRLVTFKTGKSRGFAYVEFSTEEEARKVLEMLDETDLQGHKISVAFSDPSFRRQEDSSNNLGAHSRSLAGGDSKTNKPTWHPRTQVSFVPRVLQMAPGKPPTSSSNHSAADNPTSSEGKVLSNADFRQMLLGTKK
uniref:RRM domain-containing protein n=1 Tax=Timema tahoe TaxID=61484 RepID=A0A7R9IK01_9NEOP|nr:unnamed protein product [Timema tahoe]